MVQNARGTRDNLPDRQILRQEIINTLRTIFEQFGFSPLDTPALERYDVLSLKYAGGAEILKETFRLSDQGGRELGLRYDLTIPLARVVAQNPELKFPFRRYHIDKVWRDGPVSFARYREFTQCDVDSVGAPEGWQDLEILQIIDKCFSELKLPVVIHINHVGILREIMIASNIPENKHTEAMLSLDKLRKAGSAEVQKELHGLGIDVQHVKTLFELIAGEGLEAHARLAKKLKNSGYLAVVESLLQQSVSCINTVRFEPSLARGLSYYTGIIVEAFVKDSEVNSAVCAGGRYDSLIGSLVEGNREFPAVGVSFGVDRIFDSLSAKKSRKSVSQVLIIPIKTIESCMPLAAKLRAAGINTEIAYDKSLTKALDYANAMSIPWTIIAGQRELTENKVKLKNMKSGHEDLVNLDHAIKQISP